ncbi:MAG: DNA polymerase III subunit delta' [Candidatus Omnitrophica bacterium]|nr:DNA polymerase III subunit delta' [Candidatus Omnitrophota bacterium]
MDFAEIKGQDKAIGQLEKYSFAKRMASSYLFTGPEAVGKKLTALSWAKQLNCQAPNPQACGLCGSCIKIDKLVHPDVHLFTSEENDQLESVKIEDIRLLQKEINLKAYEGNYKVFIIDNAHNLTLEAGNALLKVLEEPPDKSLIILITHKPSFMLKTIVSRCRVVKFFPLKRDFLSAQLEESYFLNKEKAHFLSYFSEGRIGLALRIKDSNILEKKNMIFEDFFASGKAVTEKTYALDKNEMYLILNVLSLWLRDLYLLKTAGTSCRVINLDYRDKLIALSKKYTIANLEAFLKEIMDALNYTKQNVNPRLLFSHLQHVLKG